MDGKANDNVGCMLCICFVYIYIFYIHYAKNDLYIKISNIY